MSAAALFTGHIRTIGYGLAMINCVSHACLQSIPGGSSYRSAHNITNSVTYGLGIILNYIWLIWQMPNEQYGVYRLASD